MAMVRPQECDWTNNNNSDESEECDRNFILHLLHLSSALRTAGGTNKQEGAEAEVRR